MSYPETWISSVNGVSVGPLHTDAEYTYDALTQSPRRQTSIYENGNKLKGCLML